MHSQHNRSLVLQIQVYSAVVGGEWWGGAFIVPRHATEQNQGVTALFLLFQWTPRSNRVLVRNIWYLVRAIRISGSLTGG
jgi:hypothetical protein